LFKLLLGLKKRVFWRFFTQMTANLVRLVFKKSARYISFNIIPHLSLQGLGVG